MRTDKMMIKTDPDTMAAFNRARIYKGVAALVILFSFGVMTVIAPPIDSEPMVNAASATKFADPVELPGLAPYPGASVDADLTNGVDMHG